MQQAADDPLVPVSIRDNFYQSSAFFPMPFALITTKNEAGVTSIGPYSLVFPLDISEEHSMLLVSRASSNTATNLRRNGKCALHWIEFDKPLLQTVVDLGYPGVPPEEKMRDVPFELMQTPTPEFRDDPDFPLLIKGAFQIFECELDGRFEYHPVRRAPRQLVEDYLALKVKNILQAKAAGTPGVPGHADFLRLPWREGVLVCTPRRAISFAGAQRQGHGPAGDLPDGQQSGQRRGIHRGRLRDPDGSSEAIRRVSPQGVCRHGQGGQGVQSRCRVHQLHPHALGQPQGFLTRQGTQC
jgi:flavin reductase (DIM6/NTAB) family NADH-FMN oxidoreductase RutF